MPESKTLVPCAAVIIGIMIGWFTANQETDNAEYAKALDDEKLRAILLERIETNPTQWVRDADQKTLWEAFVAFQILSADGDEEKVLGDIIEKFMKTYEDGMELGEHQIIADGLYDTFKARK